MGTITSLLPLLESVKNPVLGLDAYGVIYNNKGFFDSMPAVFDYCKANSIPIMMLTNNATQSINIIYNKMKQFNLPVPKDHIVSSGCGLYDLPDLTPIVKNRSVFVYGYDSSKQYVIDAGGTCVDSPHHADVIVMAASVGSKNHSVYRQVFLALNDNPNCPVICINPDHYVYNSDGFMRVMGFYAHTMAKQLNRNDFIWMGKPFNTFSDLVKRRLNQLNYNPSQLIFCDDNPINIHRLTHDLGCQGVVITGTGIFNKVPIDDETLQSLTKLSKCKI
jgi:ribonucleotide monophosphatase NagD (HAD superfamily)